MKTRNTVLTVCCVLAACGVRAAFMEPWPVPREFSRTSADVHPFGPSTTVTVSCPDASAAGWVRSHFEIWFGKDRCPRVTAGTSSLSVPEGDEAYAAKASGGAVELAANTLAGIRFAAQTVRQQVMLKRGEFRTEEKILSSFTLRDWPMLPLRAMHVCWMPETPVEEIEHMIRMAAMLRFNAMVLETWGTFVSEKHPWWTIPGATMTKAEISRLVTIGRDLGVTLIPQLPAFGHASCLRRSEQTHATLDRFPEYGSLYEPGGWTWCVSNPETLRVLKELIIEMHEAFGNPGYFHLGFDEAHDPMCPDCDTPAYADKLAEFFNGLCGCLRERKARPMMWHDMLLDRKDNRWKGFKHHGTADTAKLVDRIGKDVIVCDWEYLDTGGRNPTDMETEWPTMAYFASKGLSLAASPWRNYASMDSQARKCKELGGIGFVATTWGRPISDRQKIWMFSSSAAWGSDRPWQPWNVPTFARYRRMIVRDSAK